MPQTHPAAGRHQLLPLARVHELQASLDSITPIFVLIDPMVSEPLAMDTVVRGVDPQSAREFAWQRHVTRIVLTKRCSLPLHQCPYLVALTGLNDPLLESTLEWAHEERAQALADGLDGEGMAVHRIGGWIQGTMHPEQLAEILSSMCRVNTESPTYATYLRLADRRALALLRYVVGDTRAVGQFGRLQRWVYLDTMGVLSVLQSPGGEASVLRLSHQEWSRMESGEAINRALAQWLGEVARIDGSALPQLTAQELYGALEKAVAEAKRAVRQWPHRFTRLCDQTTWAALSLLYPNLLHSDAVHALLQQNGSPDDPPEPLRYLHHGISALLQPAHGAAG